MNKFLLIDVYKYIKLLAVCSCIFIRYLKNFFFTELQPLRERTMETEVKIDEEPVILRETSRVWTPIDHFNRDYVDKLVSQEKDVSKVDYIKENKVLID